MSLNHIPLTEEEEEFLKALNEEFKDRYTENDEDFKAIMNEKLSPPPVLKSWFEHRNSRYNNYHDRGDDKCFHRYRDDRNYDRYPQSSQYNYRHPKRHRDSAQPNSRP